jgi:hypothetical protein
MSVESHGGMILRGESQRTQRGTCPSATLSTINPTWTDQGLCGERPGDYPPEPWHGLIGRMSKVYTEVCS